MDQMGNTGSCLLVTGRGRIIEVDSSLSTSSTCHISKGKSLYRVRAKGYAGARREVF